MNENLAGKAGSGELLRKSPEWFDGAEEDCKLHFGRLRSPPWSLSGGWALKHRRLMRYFTSETIMNAIRGGTEGKDDRVLGPVELPRRFRELP
jgi:hypothetical protein